MALPWRKGPELLRNLTNTGSPHGPASSHCTEDSQNFPVRSHRPHITAHIERLEAARDCQIEALDIAGYLSVQRSLTGARCP